MKICIMSDLHGILPNIEPCDLVLIAGDIVPLHEQRSYPKSEDWFYITFSKWIENLPCNKVLITAGNHDFYLERCPFPKVNISEWTKGKCEYLQDEKFIYNNKVIWGTPWVHKFGNWAFMLEDEGLTKKYELIPKNIDILFCHDTPNIGDLSILPPNKWSSVEVNAGNNPLAEAICKARPRYVFCGHLHKCKSKYFNINSTIEIYNVSLLDNEYRFIYEPLYLDI